MPKSRILVIDDEAAIRDSPRMTLEYEGYEFVGAATGQEGLALAEREGPDLVLLDVKMPGMDGLEVLDRLRNMNESLPIVVISGHGTISTAVDATKKGAFDFIEKPFASERVLVSLRNALDQRQLRDENRSLKKAVEVRHQMIGDSQSLKQVMAAIGRAAPTNATVLIMGESGVGKELVARTTKVDVRVIAATNKTLEEEIDRGHFREDLYFRLAVIPIYVPPLRERPDDIPLLVRHYMDYFSRENNVRPKRVTQSAMEALQRYRWKGNIRELRNTVERMIIMTGGDTIDLPDLPDSVRSPSSSSASGGVAPPKPGGGAGQAEAGTLREFKENAERAFLVGKLRENRWDKSQNPQNNGTPRRNLHQKLEQYQISQDSDG